MLVLSYANFRRCNLNTWSRFLNRVIFAEVVISGSLTELIQRFLVALKVVEVNCFHTEKYSLENRLLTRSKSSVTLLLTL